MWNIYGRVENFISILVYFVVIWYTFAVLVSCSGKNLATLRGHPGPMLWFLKYFRRKIQRKNWRFCFKTKLKYATF
jgi:hypothetical protein